MSDICHRCGATIGWEWYSQWPVYCRIQIGRACQIFNPLTGGGWQDDAWGRCEAHPAIQKCEAQEAVIQWHNQDLPPSEWAGRVDENAQMHGNSGGVFGDGGSYSVSLETAKRDARLYRRSPYRLCRACHDEFIGLIGAFIGLSPASETSLEQNPPNVAEGEENE